MENEERLSEQESLAPITSMIQRVKSSYHDSGTSILLWGAVVTIASFVNYLQRALFIASCFTPFKYYMLFGAIVAMSCWFIPGIILLKRYNQQKKVNV